MKILKELAIIMGILFVSHVIKEISNIPIPATVLGMIIMLLLLLSGIVKAKNIEKTANFLLDNLTFLFIPGGVGLITSFGLIKGQVIKILLVVVAATAIGIATTGLTIKLLIKYKKRWKK